MAHVTLGSTHPLQARQYLEQALDRANYEKINVVNYSPSMGHYLIGVQTAVRVVKGVTGVASFIPIPRSPAGSK